jgi:serine/threonine-protein kinase
MASVDQRVGEYVLEAQLGAGAFGQVWRAHHHVWVDQLVAVKIPTDPQYLRNLQGEGAAIHGLVHPNIVRAMGFDPFAATPYLVTEYIPGTSLRPLIKSRQLSVTDAVAVMRQVLEGLRYAHEHNVIHRDVKPENILVHERALRDGFEIEGVIKVTDFGLGQAGAGAGNGGSIAYSASMRSPEAREIAGTLDYMSPEQRDGSAPDPRMDLYACGVVLYEMLTGERPVGTEVPSDRNGAAPKALDEVFRRSYARLDKRFASAADFLAALPRDGARRASPPPLPNRDVAAPVANSGKCPQCRQQTDPSDQFCIHCGVQLVANVRRCARCGAFPDAKDRFCIFCGQVLTNEALTV